MSAEPEVELCIACEQRPVAEGSWRGIPYYLCTACSDEWPNCATPDCENKACEWSGTGRCYPCSVAIVGEAEMERRYNATHDEPWNQCEDA